MALNVINVDWTPIYDLGKQIVQLYKEELSKEKVNASGSLSASADFDLDFNADDITMYFIANSYWWFVEKGRQKTKGGGESWPWEQSKTDISNWIRNKVNRGWFIPSPNQTIPRTDKEIKRVAYVIVRKIHQEGFYTGRFAGASGGRGLHILENVLEIAEMRGLIESAVNKIIEQYDNEINVSIEEI